MTRFQVPERHVAPLRFVATASDELFDRLYSALTASASSRGELEDRVQGLFSADDDVPRATPTVGAILAACVTRSSEGAGAAAWAADLAEADELGLDEKAREVFRGRMERILEVDALTRLAKAADLLTESDKPYGEARIISDIRPVFLDDPSDPPTGAVLVHTLKIDYYSREGSEGFSTAYFALDDIDLEQLLNAVKRAREKAASLHKVIADAGLDVMAPLRGAGETRED
jgi:hypothetical protein